MTDETVAAYEAVLAMVHDGKPLELEQRALNALAMHEQARVHKFDATPPLVAEVLVKIFDGLTERIVCRTQPPAPPPQPVHYEYRGLICETHGQVAHRRQRLASGDWTCCECVPLEET